MKNLQDEDRGRRTLKINVAKTITKLVSGKEKQQYSNNKQLTIKIGMVL
jgi:hypothetical protein